MAGQNIAEILDLPFDVRSFRDYLNHPDSELRAAARRVKQLRDNGLVDSNFRTTRKYEEQQDLARRQREQATTQAQATLPDEETGTPRSPFGPIVEERAAGARAAREEAWQRSTAQQQQANRRAEERGDPLPFPNAGTGQAPRTTPTGQPVAQRVSPRVAEQAAEGPWAAVARILSADPMAWNTEQEVLYNQSGQASYILVRDGRTEVVSQAQFRSGLNTASVQERKRDQQFMKQFWGNRYKGPTDGSIDPAGLFQNAMEQYAAFSTTRNYYQFAASQGDPLKFKPLDNKALTGMAGGAGGVGGAVTTQRTVTYQDFTDDEAAAILEDFYRDALGRRPNKKESQKFAELLRKRAAEKPSVVTSTSGGGTTTVRERAGFGTADARMLARQQAESRPGFRPYQLGTKAFDGFMAALQSPFG